MNDRELLFLEATAEGAYVSLRGRLRRQSYPQACEGDEVSALNCSAITLLHPAS